jgi:hypothetical protein
MLIFSTNLINAKKYTFSLGNIFTFCSHDLIKNINTVKGLMRDDFICLVINTY